MTYSRCSIVRHTQIQMLEMMIRSRKNSKDDTLITEIAEQENTPPGVRNGSFSHESKGDESTEGKILRLISIAFKWLKIIYTPWNNSTYYVQ